MNRIQVLDCTLRDGGYCNQWKFGFDNAKKIVNGLMESGIDIIECGFLTNRAVYDPNVTKYTTTQELASVIPENRNGKIYVAMINYGDYDVNDLPENDGSSIDGIRVAFHKKNLMEALEVCKQIKGKGYKVFVQAMVSLCYEDGEFLDLIRLVNEFQPYAFYIVDSFGVMKEKDLTRLFYMVEHNLMESIRIGYHSHNNMQLAYSNAQRLVTIQTNRSLIIDTSVYGMGRGAGNLNTELFVGYLNENTGRNYELKPLLTIIDEIINDFYQSNRWGYSLPNYLSASHNAHPNYAGYLDDKKTLTVEAMDEIFKMMDDEKKVSYDKEYIEELYLRYMDTGRVQEAHKAALKEKLQDKTVLLIAPGKSSSDEREKIISYMHSNHVVTISINFDYQHEDTDFIFLSNLRRFRELEGNKRRKCIVTSNIPADNVYLQTTYKDLLSTEETVKDNAGLMAIRFLMDYGVRTVVLAGFDGYSHDAEENYGDSQMVYIMRSAVLDAMNIGMEKTLREYSDRIDICFLTQPHYVKLGKEEISV